MTSTVPVQNAEAERAVLSAMLRQNGCIADVVLLLREEDFYHDASQRIWRAVVGLWNENKPADLVTTAARLHSSGQIENIGGYGYLAEVFETSGTSANVEHYARIVRDLALRRSLLLAGSEIVNQAEHVTGPAEEALEAAERRIFALSREGVGDDERSAAEVTDEVFDRVDARQQRARGGGRLVAGLPTGFTSLDALLAGLQAGEFIVLAARPSVGKTTLGLAIAKHVALVENEPVLFVSLEQARAEVGERALCDLAGIDGQRLRLGYLSQDEQDRLHEAGDRFRQAPLRFSDAPSQRLLRISAAARRAKSKGRLSLLVIDYLQLIEPESRRDPRHEQVAQISRKLKHLARELAVPVLVMAQLNRESEQRSGQRPRLADLRESGSIEADADTVLLLHRPADHTDRLEVIVGKQRNGPTGSIVLRYDRDLHRFSDLADEPAFAN